MTDVRPATDETLTILRDDIYNAFKHGDPMEPIWSADMLASILVRLDAEMAVRTKAVAELVPEPTDEQERIACDIAYGTADENEMFDAIVKTLSEREAAAYRAGIEWAIKMILGVSPTNSAIDRAERDGR